MVEKLPGWKKDYDLGIEDIDLQHRYFLNLINRLADELRMNTDPSRRAALISELNAYARFHFVSEENIMAKAHYPQLAEHRRHHLALISELNSKEALLKLEATDRRAEDVIDFLLDWFLRHTTGEDRLFAEFYHGRQAER